jgi:LacI family transcriptional regulator
MATSTHPTVYDVARKAGVSIATVSRVLNTPEQVRQATRSRVLEAIDELGFTPAAEAVARARKGVGRVGVITPFFTYSSFVQRMRGISAELADGPYEMIIYPVDSLERLQGYLAMLPVTRRVDGLVLLSLPLLEPAARRLMKHKLETVLVEYRCAGFSSIEIDDRAGGALAAEYLIQKGYQRLAFLGPAHLPDYSVHPEKKRLDGYRQALNEAGIDLPEAYILHSSLSIDDIRRAVVQLISMPTPPQALFAANDDLALRVLRALQELNLQAPKDLAVMGFDDIDMAELLGLTTISQALDESGRMAAQLLKASLVGAQHLAQNIELQPRLVARQTA